MTEFDAVAVGKASVPSLIVSAVLMIAIPVLFLLFWRMRHKEGTNLGYLLAGALGFVVSARVLELAVHYFCIVTDNPVSRFINGSTAAYVIYGTVMAGVFEECGRYVVLKYILKKNRTRENAVLYGIGHGGIEILTVVLPLMITYLAIAILFSGGKVKEALDALKITEENAAAALPSVQAAAAFDFATAAMNVVERLLAMFFHIGLTVVVFYGVIEAKKSCLPLAILLHMAADAFPALYQRDVLPLWAVEVWGALWIALVVLIAVKLYGRMKERPAE
ncbi:MAG: YhfC family intramembrane metalloprotease [Clostridia bacterium]|nr:YhfC family intramembrane metalloprotease [Clostridia bacterium]